MAETKKLFLLDAYALIFRAYYAFIKNPMFNSQKLNTSAIYGFLNTLDEVLRTEKPTHCAVVFDPPTPTFRNEMYALYKANRQATPADIKLAVPFIKRIIEGFNIPVISVDGFEADDTIGTLAKMAEKEGFTVYMMTPDKDYCQLVSENIFIYKPRKGGAEAEIWGVKEVLKSFEVKKPEQVIEVLAMWGDTADNVPGIPGIGEKIAKEIVSKYGGLDGLYKNTHHLKGKQQQNVIAFKEQAYLSKKLVTIELNVPVEFNAAQYRLTSINKDLLKEVFSELEFTTIANRILNNPPFNEIEENQQVVEIFNDFSPIKTIDDVEHFYFEITKPEELQEIVNEFSKEKMFCFDTETTGLSVIEDQVIGISLSKQRAKAYYIPISANKSESNIILNILKPLLENENILKIGQNIKFDIQMLKKHGIEVKGKLFDTMIAHYLLFPDLKHNMDFLSEKYLHYKPVSIETLIGKKGKDQLNMREANHEKVVEYACEDADVTLQLKEVFEKMLLKEDLLELFHNIEMPLVYVLADMEYTGVTIDNNALSIFAEELKIRIIETEKIIFSLAGCEFNINSPKQLGEILFEKLKITDNFKKTKTGQYSTGEPELVKLKDKHEIIGKILEYRSLTKLLSTYVEALPKLIHKKTNKIHTSYNQAVTTTGRLSSNNPNLQNIPIKTEDGREIRKAFCASADDLVILSADYSQIELRLMAHLSNDSNMIDAFIACEDIHAATAAKIYNVDLKDVSRTQRANAKSANFGIIYGISAFGLAENLSISRTEAKQLIDGYFNTYPAVKDYMNKSVETARKQTFVKTLFGRKRWLADITSQNSFVRSFAERNAINAPIQGTAADIIKIAMIKIFNILNEKQFQTKMIMQVHDELVFEIPKNELEQVKPIIVAEMQNAAKLNVPLTVEAAYGSNWLDAH